MQATPRLPALEIAELQGVQPLRPWRERDLRGTLLVVLNLGGVMAPRAVVSIDSLPASGRFAVTAGVNSTFRRL